MPRSELFVALDIGTTKVCTLVAEVSGEDQVEILGVGLAPSMGMKKGVVVDIPATTAAIRESVAAAAQMAGIRIGSVFVGITGEHIASLNRRVEVPVTQEVAEEHLREARRTARQVELEPGREVLHSFPRQYIVDGVEGVRNPVGMSAQRLAVEAHLVTAASSFVENVAKCVHRAGLVIEEIVVEPLATGLAVLTDAERQLGVVLADIGGGTTDVALWSEGAISHTAVIPVGGNHVSADLALCLRLEPTDAEQLKLASGACRVQDVEPGDYVRIRMIAEEAPREIPRRLLAEIIGPRVEEQMHLLRDHVRKAAAEGVVANSCVLSGGGAQIPGLVEVAHQVLELPVRVGRPREILDLRGLVDSPIYSTAVGMLHFAAARPAGRTRSSAPESLQRSAWGLLAGLFRKFRRKRRRG